MTANFLLIVIVSIVVSTFGSIVGFGGGVFLVPVLVLAFHYPLPVAVGTVIVALVPSSIASTIQNHRQGLVDYKMGIVLEIPTMIGVFIGSLLLAVIPVQKAELIFIVFILLLGLTFFRKKKEEQETENILNRMNAARPKLIIKHKKHGITYSVNLFVVTFFGLFSGTIAGLFGIGGGFLKTPIMIKVFRIPPKIAASTALFMIIITSLSGSASHYFLGHIVFRQSLPVIIGFFIGALTGSFFNKKFTHKTIELLIGISLILASLAMAVNLLVESGMF